MYDQLDFFIIREIFKAHFDKKEISAWELAKKYEWEDRPKTLFCELNKKDFERFWTKKTSLIGQRLRRYPKIGIAKFERDPDCKRRYRYELNGEKVIFCKHKFPNGYKDAIMIKEDKWIIFQI